MLCFSLSQFGRQKWRQFICIRFVVEETAGQCGAGTSIRTRTPRYGRVGHKTVQKSIWIRKWKDWHIGETVFGIQRSQMDANGGDAPSEVIVHRHIPSGYCKFQRNMKSWFDRSHDMTLLFVSSSFKVNAIRLQGIEHVLSFTATEDNQILMRSHKIQLKKSGLKTPRIELNEIGPSIDFTIRRTKIASEDLYKLARKQPRQLKVGVKKNISRDRLGNMHGRVHVGKQKLGTIQTRKVRALKKTPAEKKSKRQEKKVALKSAKAKE